MAKCNATTLTSSELLGMKPLLFAPNVDKTSRPRHTMPTASARTGQQGIVRIAKSAASKVAEKIGQGPFTRLSLQQMRKLANFAMLTNHWKSFTQMAVLQTVQKNTVADAKVVCLQGQSKNNQKCTHQKRRNGPQAQKTSSLASLITPQNANSILGLILILSTFFNFMRNSKGAVLCLELK
jgi:hypothetical protein